MKLMSFEVELLKFNFLKNNKFNATSHNLNYSSYPKGLNNEIRKVSGAPCPASSGPA